MPLPEVAFGRQPEAEQVRAEQGRAASTRSDGGKGQCHELSVAAADCLHGSMGVWECTRRQPLQEEGATTARER